MLKCFRFLFLKQLKHQEQNSFVFFFFNLPNKIQSPQWPFHCEETGGICRESTNHDGAESAEHCLETALGHYRSKNNFGKNQQIKLITCKHQQHPYTVPSHQFGIVFWVYLVEWRLPNLPYRPCHRRAERHQLTFELNQPVSIGPKFYFTALYIHFIDRKWLNYADKWKK